MSTPVTVAETQEKIHRSKTKQADPQSGYLEEKIVGSEYINITEEDGSVGKRLVVEVDAAAIVSGVVDHKVKVDASDTANYLKNKIIATSGVAVAPDGTNPKTMKITGAYVAGAGISITGTATKTIASTITQVVTEDPFTGHATKVPTSEAVSDLLQECTITDNADVISGDALLYNSKFISTNEMSFAEKSAQSSEGMWGIDKHPNRTAYLSKQPKWEPENARGSLGEAPIFSTYSADSTNSWCVAFVPVAICEDISNEDAKVYLDVMFKCAKTAGASTTARVKATVNAFKGGFEAITPAYISEEKDVVYPASTGASLVRNITYTFDLATFVVAGLTFDAPVFGYVALSCGASNAVPAPTATNAIILGARFRYKTKTLGLRIADVYEEV